MLGLRDLFQIRPSEMTLKALVNSGPGLTIIAGPEGQIQAKGENAPLSTADFLPSGRTMVFRTLVDEIIAADKDVFGILLTSKPRIFHAGRRSWRHIQELVVDTSHSYADRIMEAIQRNPAMILVDDLNENSVIPILEAAVRHQRVITQLDAPLRGEGVWRQVIAMGGLPNQAQALQWVLAVQRVPVLCTHCRRAVLPNASDLQRLQQLLQELIRDSAILESPLGEAPMYSDASGCKQCQFTGRQGDVSILDLCRFNGGECETILPMEACLWRLVQRGMIPLRDLLDFNQEIMVHLYNRSRASENALREMQGMLERTRSELEAVNRVLEHRNQALFSFQDIGYALIRSNDLYDLAGRVCRRAIELCRANRAILYYLRSSDQVEVAAVTGWESIHLHQHLAAQEVFPPRRSDVLQPFKGLPPGVQVEEKEAPRPQSDYSGLYVPLVAQDERVGAMIIQSSGKTQFNPGDVAMLQAFANQAALALQRAGLVEDLRIKIAELERAQAGLAEKERMLREMELARQVQLSVLPQTFPFIPGFSFTGRIETARQVGGDFYDVIDLDENHFGIMVADVSDKGMPAALYMVLTRTLLVAQARRDYSPARVLREVNHLLQELSTARMFVTVFYGVIEKSTQRLRYARAGHDMPVLLTPEGIQPLHGAGIALGVVQEDAFSVEEIEIQLYPGNRLILYTDGLTDVFNAHHEIFGRERLYALLETHASQEAPELCQTIFRALQEYQGAGEQFDDQTLLIVEVSNALPIR